MMAGDVYQSLLAQGFTVDQINRLMQLGVLNEQGGAISRQMERAQQLREAPGPSARFSGKGYVAANPLEFLGAGINRVRGEYMANEAERKAKEAAEEKSRLRAEFLKQMMRGRQPAATPGPAAMPGAAPAPTNALMFPYGAKPGTPLSGWQ